MIYIGILGYNMLLFPENLSLAWPPSNQSNMMISWELLQEGGLGLRYAPC